MPDRLGPGDLNEWVHGVIESAMDAIITVDAQQRIIIFNHAAELMFKVSAADVVGRHLDRLIPERFRASHNQHFAEFAATGRTSRTMQLPGELVGLRSDGTEFPVEATVSSAPVGDKSVYTAIVRDVSVRKQIEHQVIHLQKMEALGRLASGIAHDFNNLLMIIRGNVEMTMSDGLGPEHAKLNLQSVIDAVERGRALVSQLMVFSRQRPAKEFEPVSVDDLFSTVEKMVQRLIGEHIVLAVHHGRQISPIMGDAHQLFQVLVNLVVNAKDAMPDGGTVTVSAEMVEVTDADHIPHLASGPHAVISVADTGTGMTPEVKARMFDPFFTTKPEGKGTGLGLSLVMGTMLACNGNVVVESEVGRGTVIKLYFPTRTEKTKPTELPGAVLVVEDESALRHIICEMLVSQGFSVLEAMNGAEAIEVAKRHKDKISVVITDLVMPSMGGVEMSRRLRRILPNFALIMMSGYNDLSVETSDLLADGMTRLLRKPFAMHDMLAAIKELTSSDG